MQNYKVEVQNHSEGMEAQDLFLELGFKKSTLLEDGYPKYVVADQVSLTDGKESGGAHIYFVGTNYKKITLPELRDMVTPKQKEYLVKTDTGYTLQVLSDVIDGHDGIIEVPDGAEVATENKEGLIYFWKNNGGDWFSRSYKKWKKFGSMQGHIEKLNHKIIWQRKESLNDQVASAEEYRKSFAHTPKATLDIMNNIQNAFEKAQGAINAQNAMAKLFAYPQYISGVVHGKEFTVKPNQKKDESKLFDTGKFILEYFTQPEELPFVGDTQQTLNERQSQYGNFSEVAEMTQQLLTVMGQYGYEYLPGMHKEALHMICSKMARIVNGDHNHLDSWHDIGGYAKLIENNIK
ncbi:MAG: hypothetical protein J5965_20640 [Aeriscardovia sp.]|nr:hypothetical protein [Aeriscardovia sp.]